MKKYSVWIEGEPERSPTDRADGNAAAISAAEAAVGYAEMRARVDHALDRKVPGTYVVCVRELASDEVTRWRFPVRMVPELGAAELLP